YRGRAADLAERADCVQPRISRSARITFRVAADFAEGADYVQPRISRRPRIAVTQAADLADSADCLHGGRGLRVLRGLTLTWREAAADCGDTRVTCWRRPRIARTRAEPLLRGSRGSRGSRGLLSRRPRLSRIARIVFTAAADCADCAD